LVLVEVMSAEGLRSAFDEMKSNRAEALIVIPGSLTYIHRKLIADLAIIYRLPSCHAFWETVCHAFWETVAVGGLVSLGPDIVAMTAQGAAYVDKIIRGARPAELPVQQPVRYQLHVNLKTAKALGVTVPQALVYRADEMIE